MSVSNLSRIGVIALALSLPLHAGSTFGQASDAWAVKNKLPVASIKNAAAKFIEPTIQTTTAAAAGAAKNMPADFRVSLTNAPGDDAYPVASFTWLLVYQRQADPAKGKKLVDFVRWALTEGEGSAAALDYAPLPETVSKPLLEKLASIQVGTTS